VSTDIIDGTSPSRRRNKAIAPYVPVAAAVARLAELFCGCLEATSVTFVRM
jgi:hypothetical protein